MAQQPSIGFEGDWLVFTWDDYWERCDNGATCGSQWLSGTRRLASAGAELLAASYFDGSAGPVSAWEFSNQALFAQLADPFFAAVPKNGLAAGARAMPEGRHDLLVTWHVASSPLTSIDVYAARLTDGTWSNLGRVAGGTSWAWSESAALAQNGTAWVAVTETVESGGSGVGVYRRNGAVWTLVGPIREAYSLEPSLAVAADGTPYVAYADHSGDVVVERWDGSAWTSLGAVEPDGTEHASSPSLALDADGHPVVALCSHVEGLEEESRLWVRRWTGSAWETVGTALNVSDPVRAAAHPALALDPSGKVAVAFLEWTGEGELVSTPPAAPTATWDLRVVMLNR